MKVEIKIDEKIKENRVIVEANEMTEEISDIISSINNKTNNQLKVFLDEEMYLLNIDEIESVYANDKKVFIKTKDKEYVSKQRLYELEDILPRNKYIRISNSEIINLNKVKSINTKITGTIVITFYSGYQTYSSRRYINKIKEALGI